MKPILAKVTAIEKRGEQYLVIVQISPKYRGSFNTLAFGEIKPHSGSFKDGRLDLVYHQNPGLNNGDPFPLWTLRWWKEEEGNASRWLAYQCNRSRVDYAAARYRSVLVCADDFRSTDDELIWVRGRAGSESTPEEREDATRANADFTTHLIQIFADGLDGWDPASGL
jgi:hypothetical protein